MNKDRRLHDSYRKNMYLCFFVGLLLFNSCERTRNKSKETIQLDTASEAFPVDTFELLPEYDALKNVGDINAKLNKIKQTGDTNAYDELSVAYSISGELHSLYYYSLIMANRYGYNKAYLDLYYALSEPYTGEGFDDLDKRTQRLAIYYLLKAYELGDTRALGAIEERFGKDTIPKSFDYKNLE